MFANFDWIGAMRSSPVMLIILACSVVTFGFAMERILYFWKRRGSAEAVYQMASEKVRAGSLKEAAWACQATLHPMGPVASQVLKYVHQSPELVEEKQALHLSGAAALAELDDLKARMARERDLELTLSWRLERKGTKQ